MNASFDESMEQEGIEGSFSDSESNQVGVSLADLHLNERWGADDNDLRLFKALGRFFAGEAGARANVFPGFVKSTEPYRALISRGTIGDGNKAKTLLAVIMELDKVEQLSAAQFIGSLVDNADPGLEVVKMIIVPMLVEDLAIYACWQGYMLPASIENERVPAKKKQLIMDYTKNWILTKLGEDPYMTHYVERIEEETLTNLMQDTMYLGEKES